MDIRKEKKNKNKNDCAFHFKLHLYLNVIYYSSILRGIRRNCSINGSR